MENKSKARFMGIVSIFLVISLAISLLYLQNLFVISGVLGTFAMMWIFYIADKLFKIEFKLKHYLCFLLISMIGAYLNPIYFFISYYDKVLHFLTPLLWCSVIFFVVSKNKNLNLLWKIIITVCIFMTLMVGHEIIEYLGDIFFNLKLQGVYGGNIKLERLAEIQSPIEDTMLDLIFDFLGAAFFGIAKFFFAKPESKKM